MRSVEGLSSCEPVNLSSSAQIQRTIAAGLRWNFCKLKSQNSWSAPHHDRPRNCIIIWTAAVHIMCKTKVEHGLCRASSMLNLTLFRQVSITPRKKRSVWFLDRTRCCSTSTALKPYRSVRTFLRIAQNTTSVRFAESSKPFSSLLAASYI